MMRKQEKLFTTEDVNILFEYRKSYLQDVEERDQILHPIASQVIVDGLVAYGWKCSELALIDGVLMNQVRKFVNLNQLAQEENVRAYSSERVWATLIQEANGKRRRATEIDLQGNKRARRDKPNYCTSSHDQEVAEVPSQPAIPETSQSSLSRSDDEEMLENDESSVENRSTNSSSTSCTSLGTPDEVVQGLWKLGMGE